MNEDLRETYITLSCLFTTRITFKRHLGAICILIEPTDTLDVLSPSLIDDLLADIASAYGCGVLWVWTGATAKAMFVC